MSESNDKALVVRQPASLDIMSMGKVFHESGYFKDAKSAAQAIVKIQAGAEVGLPPVASMTGIFIVQDKVTFSAVTMAALVKKSKRYTYRVKEMTDQACEVEFYELLGDKYEPIGVSRFTIEDAKKANLAGKNIWQQYPRNMLFSRALSNGARWYTPDIFGGPVYTPDELGAEVMMTGEGEMVVHAVDAEPPSGNGHKAETPKQRPTPPAPAKVIDEPQQRVPWNEDEVPTIYIHNALCPPECGRNIWDRWCQLYDKALALGIKVFDFEPKDTKTVTNQGLQLSIRIADKEAELEGQNSAKQEVKA